MQEENNEHKPLPIPDLVIENIEEVSVGIKNYNLEKHKRVWDALFYSHQRMDILMISISGGGIYVCLEAIKFLNEKGFCINWLVKASALLFVLAIISNFISQMMSAYVYSCDYQSTEIEVTCEEDGVDKRAFTDHLAELETKSVYYEKRNKIASNASLILMSLGLLTIVVFFLVTF